MLRLVLKGIFLYLKSLYFDCNELQFKHSPMFTSFGVVKNEIVAVKMSFSRRMAALDCCSQNGGPRLVSINSSALFKQTWVNWMNSTLDWEHSYRYSDWAKEKCIITIYLKRCCLLHLPFPQKQLWHVFYTLVINNKSNGPLPFKWPRALVLCMQAHWNDCDTLNTAEP